MTKESLAKIYNFHHQKENRYNFGIYEKERAEFYLKFIGDPKSPKATGSPAAESGIGGGKKILDLGCRDGTLTKYYLKGNQITGVDIDKKALEYAKKKYGFRSIWLDLNSEWEVLSNELFDAAVMGEVLEHLFYPKKILSRVYRSLKPGGILLGSVPNAFRIPTRLRILFGLKKGTSFFDPTHVNHFSRKELLETLKEAGFKDVLLEPMVKKQYLWLEKIWPGSFSYLIMFKANK